jgi:hypothetical protein
MRIYWHNLGLHFEPESEDDRSALLMLGESFHELGVGRYERVASDLQRSGLKKLGESMSRLAARDFVGFERVMDGPLTQGVDNP